MLILPLNPLLTLLKNSSDAVMTSEDVDKSVDKLPVDKLVDKLPVAPINDVDKPSAVPLCSTMPVDKSVDKLPVNNSSVAMTNDVADKPVDKPPALLSWPRSTVLEPPLSEIFSHWLQPVLSIILYMDQFVVLFRK